MELPSLFCSYSFMGILVDKENPWSILANLSEEIIKVGKTLKSDEYEEKCENIWIHKTAKIASSALLKGPLIVGESVEIRHSAFIRGSVLIMEKSVVGNSVELKNSIIGKGSEIPHFNYIGDSILGEKAHFGAGSITSNVRCDRLWAYMKNDKGEKIPTGLRKAGALVGDYVEIGCNAVLNPASVVGRNTIIYPLTSVRGIIMENSIVKNDGKVYSRN